MFHKFLKHLFPLASMALMKENSFLLSVLIFSTIVAVSSRGAVYTPPNVERLTDRFSHVSVNRGFSQFFGGSNIHLKNNGTYVDILLDKTTGNLYLIVSFFMIIIACYSKFMLISTLFLGFFH